VLLIGLAAAGSSVALFGLLKGELAPIEDQGNIYVRQHLCDVPRAGGRDY
jgi:hypothetical protein